VTITLAELAVRFGCEVRGNPDTQVDRVGTLQAAEAGCISFLANPAYARYLADTRASAVIVDEKNVDKCAVDALIAADPYLTYARVAAELHPAPAPQSGVHRSAVVGEDCAVPDSCEIAAGAVLGNNVTLGERVRIGPNSVVGDGVSLGDDTQLAANVSLYSGVNAGARCLFHSGVVLGADGFGIAQSPQGWIKVPQVGGVSIGDDVELGAGTAVDCGAIDDTRIGNGVRLDNHVQIGHNCVINDHTAMAAQSGVAGSTTIGARCVIGGAVAIGGHLNIVDDVYILARASVSKSITKPGLYSSVLTVEEAGKWRRIAGRIKRLDEMAKRLAALEKLVRGPSGKDT
jgi:UDP-3-O-[3-hydroxymyristoyl] glucosamine N-acyltransferase